MRELKLKIRIFLRSGTYSPTEIKSDSQLGLAFDNYTWIRIDMMITDSIVH